MSTRTLMPGPVVVASHNAGKVREIAALLGPYGVAPISAGELGLPEPEETEDTFRGNARLKALVAAQSTGLPALADDSGLVVPALGGAPGIYSARWAGPNKDFAAAMHRVHEELNAREGADRRGYFVCALALGWPDGVCDIFEGRIDGALVWPPRGSLGFGYDPMVQPDGHAITFGEMAPEAKHAISHRARAFAQLVEACLPR